MTPAADDRPLPPAGALLWGTLRRRWVTLAAVVVAALGLVAVSFSRIGQNLVYYWGPTELHAAGDKAVGATIRLGGLVADGSVKRGHGASASSSTSSTARAPRLTSSAAACRRSCSASGSASSWRHDDARGYFEGHRLMVSHSNEYRAPSEGEKAAIDQLMKSVKEGEGRSGGPAPPESARPKP
jgi:cytochrome c-type biogenesis protein CcmE